MTGFGGGISDSGADDPYARFARIRRRHHPPPNEVPGVLPIGRFLGRSDTVVAVLLEVHAYAAGLDFRLTYRGRGRRPTDHPPFVPTVARIAERIGKPVATAPDIAVVLADGSGAHALDASEAFQRMEESTGRSVLIGARGGGGNDQFDASYWLTPNPQTGLTLQFAWPQQQLPATTLALDDQEIVRATAAAVTLWPWDPSDVRERA
jgi:hypothetical protein